MRSATPQAELDAFWAAQRSRQPLPAPTPALGPADISALARANRLYNQALQRCNQAEQRDFAAALELYGEALSIREGVYGRESAVVAQTFYAMGGAALGTQPAQAAAHFRSAAECYSASLGADNRKTADALARAERCEAGDL